MTAQTLARYQAEKHEDFWLKGVDDPRYQEQLRQQAAAGQAGVQAGVQAAQAQQAQQAAAGGLAAAAAGQQQAAAVAEAAWGGQQAVEAEEMPAVGRARQLR